MNAALEQAVTRLESILDAESTALDDARFSELLELTARKNQSLLELTRLGRNLGAPQQQPEMKGRLTVLRAAVERNHRALELHVKASTEIADLIASSIADSESDGTYRARPGRYTDAGIGRR